MMFVSLFVLIVVFSLILCVHDDISELCLIACCMTALLLRDCMLLVYVGLTSIPLSLTHSLVSGLATGYTDVWEHSGGERRIVVDWSPIIEDLYSPELGNPLGCRGSACVDAMSTLHGSAPSFLRRAEGCVPWRDPSLHVGASEGLQSLFSYSSDPVFPLFSLQLRVLGDCHLTVDTFMTLEFSSYIQISDCHLRTMCLSQFRSRLSLESHSWRRVGGRLIRADSYPSSDSSVEMSDELASTLASIQEFMAGVSRRLDQIESSRQDPQPVGMVMRDNHYETIPPPTVTVSPPMVPTIEDTRLAEQEAKRGIPAASLPAKFRMPDIERYSGIGCPKIHLRLYSTVMRAHGIDDAQLVALFPMSLSGAAQRWFASVEPSRLRTWEDVAREFLTQFAFSADIDVSRRELEATRQRPEESISSFVTRWRAKVAGMVDRPKEQDQIDMVFRNLQPRFARRLVGIPFQDLRSLVQAAFSVEEAIARGLWTDTTSSPDSKGKKLIGPLGRSGEVGAISYQHRRPAHHSAYRPPTVRAPFSLPQYQYQPDYVQEPYIAQTSMQPRPSHPRAATHPPPRPYAQRPARQFTPLGMTLTRAFEKLRDAGVIVPLAPRPLPHPIPPHFRSHEHCLYHRIPGHDTERCSALHHAIQDLIDSGLVDLAGPNVTANPLPTHSTHAVPPPPGLQ
ncbi:hypothetical protein CK203_028729 [Vitis vinifera]|uniref:Retrotransposon gag domain-containing protein n=1 Tax=Vitis vinifera TaxID=29760 RepID=A0A438IGF8_VITVI|nr:hypothetical protein CK203_028729 [Vitis vinifera]